MRPRILVSAMKKCALLGREWGSVWKLACHIIEKRSQLPSFSYSCVQKASYCDENLRGQSLNGHERRWGDPRHAFQRRWQLDCSQSPFFREIIEIERVLPLMAAILIFKCTERQVRLKMAAINDKARSISTISRKKTEDCEQCRWQPVCQSTTRRGSLNKVSYGEAPPHGPIPYPFVYSCQQ